MIGIYRLIGNPAIVGCQGSIGDRAMNAATDFVYVKTGPLDTDWALQTVPSYPLGITLGGTGGTDAATARAALAVPASVLVPWSACRKIASGSATVTALSVVTLATFVRTAGEVILPMAFVSSTVAGLGFSFTNSGTVGISFWFERTANADEVSFKSKNVDVTNRTMDWMVLGMTP